MFQPTHHKIILGDSRRMSLVPDKSVQLIVTSPPYWQLKDYGVAEQIGYNQSYEEYINHLNLVWKESYRVLEDGCRLCINIGDQFARAVYYGRYKVIPIRTEIIKFCETIGFDYMGAIIWQKKTTSNTTGGASLMGSYPTPRNGIISIDYEFILIFKKPGKSKRPPKEIKEASKLTKEEWKTYFSGHWNFGGAKQTGHIAMFPEELPKRLIKMFAFVGDTVLDPFLGSGTTTIAAMKSGRNSVGYEINEEFFEIIKQKVNKHGTFNATIEFLKDETSGNFREEIKSLPYIFKDPHKFDKKIDPKKLQFGSKIDKNGAVHREEYYSVKEVISPVLLKLNNDLLVRLLGVQENLEKQEEAMEFLRLKTRKQKIFLKFDERKFDEDNRLLAYVYLKNKTFPNAHLIKKGLARAERSYEYKYKRKFIGSEEIIQ